MSLGSTDSNLVSSRSHSTGGLIDLFSEPVQVSGSHHDKVCAVPQQSHPARSVSLDLSKVPAGSEPFSLAAPSIDLFEFPASTQAPTVDLFQGSVLSSAPSLNENQPAQTSQPPPIDLFADVPQQHFAATSNEKSKESLVPKNEGWATFDISQHTAPTAQVETPAGVPSTHKSLLEIFDPFSTVNASMQWPSFETSSVHEPSVTSNPWHGGVQSGEQVPVTAENTQVSHLKYWSATNFGIRLP